MKVHAPVMRSAEFRFYEELNDFLPAARRKCSFRHRFRGTPTVKDTIQALGVPHSAVDLVLVDGEPVRFSYRLHGGERVAVYPMFERLDITPISRLRPRPLRRTRFVLDVHLGRLTRYLRMLGFDALYDRHWDDDEIIDRALSERRVILTRDLGILKQTRVTHGYWLRSQRPLEQAAEVVRAFDLAARMEPFGRCMECNGRIVGVSKARIRNCVDPDILARFDAFRQCRDCRRIYWRGSHYQRMLQRIAELAGRP